MRAKNSGSSLQQQHDHLLDVRDVSGKLLIQTGDGGTITIGEDYTAAALEAMSRYAINPRWLIYLPPTMSPSETSRLEGFLEHPAEAFQYFTDAGVRQVICEEKHMGSRAVIIVCKDQEAAVERFGISSQQSGVIYTRTGRSFFNDPVMENQLLERLQTAVQKAGLWDQLNTGWLCLDCEIMPWSVKAQELLRNQYAAVGSSARAALKAVAATLEKTKKRGMDVDALLTGINQRKQMAHQFTRTYRNYCRPVESIDDIRIAPFHIMAAEGRVFADKSHQWHMDTIAKLCLSSEIFIVTGFRTVDLTHENQVKQALHWWLEMTEKGGEGMVVKPMDFIAYSHKQESKSNLKIGKLIQPALKCRGREYLRIIYGLDYTAPHNLNHLRKRGLSLKRSLAVREFTLGIEGLQRFVSNEPLRRVHECAFAVLALESQPVDPRL